MKQLPFCRIRRGIRRSVDPLRFERLQFAAAVEQVPEVVHDAREVGVVRRHQESHVVDGSERMIEEGRIEARVLLREVIGASQEKVIIFVVIIVLLIS